MEKPHADGTMAEKTATAATMTTAGAKVPWRDLDLFLVIAVVGVLEERYEVDSRSNVMLL